MSLILIKYSIAHRQLSKTTLDFISRLINLNYAFNIPFKVIPKAKTIINGGFISQFHDYILSKILLFTILFRINKLRDTVIELGLKALLSRSGTPS